MRRADALGERHHFFGDAHFEVHAGLQHVLEQQHVALLDVAAVFAQVHGDAVGARFFGVQRGLDRVRVTGAPGLAQGGYVVDVHAEKNAIAGGHEKRS